MASTHDSIEGGDRPIPFQNREKDLRLLSTPGDAPLLLSLVGESGIGKTRLLKEARGRLEGLAPPDWVIYVDLQPLGKLAPKERPEAFLRAVISASRRPFSGEWGSSPEVATQLVRQLRGGTPRVVVMIDTAEALHGDLSFWDWLEQYWTRPLLGGDAIRQVYAGRTPVPWARLEVRRVVQAHRLGAFVGAEEAVHAQRLIEEALRCNLPTEASPVPGDVITAIGELALGHPKLSIELATYVTLHQSELPTDPAQLRKRLAETVVGTFIQHLLSDLKEHDAPWRDYLRFASVLDSLDAVVLQTFLEAVGVVKPGACDPIEFMQGLNRMRLDYAVIAWDDARGGYRLQGVLHDILRCHLKLTDSEGFQRAIDARNALFPPIG